MMTGNQAALGELYDRHSPYVYALCLTLARDENHATELLIEAFLSLWQRRGGVRGPIRNVRACLFGLVIRAAKTPLDREDHQAAYRAREILNEEQVQKM